MMKKTGLKSVSPKTRGTNPNAMRPYDPDTPPASVGRGERNPTDEGRL